MLGVAKIQHSVAVIPLHDTYIQATPYLGLMTRPIDFGDRRRPDRLLQLVWRMSSSYDEERETPGDGKLPQIHASVPKCRKPCQRRNKLDTSEEID